MTSVTSNILGHASAVEWAGAYREMGLAVAASTLEVALGDLEGGNIDEDIGARGLAAAEAVAFALGRGSERASELFGGAPEADRELAGALSENAIRLINAIGGGDELPAPLADLQARLSGAVVERPAAAAAPVEAAPLQDARPAPASGDVAAELQALRAEVEGLRKQMNRNFARLAQIIEGERP